MWIEKGTGDNTIALEESCAIRALCQAILKAARRRVREGLGLAFVNLKISRPIVECQNTSYTVSYTNINQVNLRPDSTCGLVQRRALRDRVLPRVALPLYFAICTGTCRHARSGLLFI